MGGHNAGPTVAWQERAKRVDHLANIGMRRLFQQELARGWSAWLDAYSEHKHRLQLMREVPSLCETRQPCGRNNATHDPPPVLLE